MLDNAMIEDLGRSRHHRAFENAHTPTDDERKYLAGLVRSGFYGLDADDPDDEDYAIADVVLAAGFTRSEIPERPLTLEDLSIASSLEDLVGEARSEGVWCCENGCGSGACETCPCCSAGWCVSGIDGIPDDPEARAWWLEVAAEHNPVAAALRAAEAQPQGEPSDALDLEALEVLAKAATGGEWTAYETVQADNYVTAGGGLLSGTIICGPTYEKTNTQYIAAASPQIVLALIAALRAAGGVR